MNTLQLYVNFCNHCGIQTDWSQFDNFLIGWSVYAREAVTPNFADFLQYINVDIEALKNDS